MAMEILQKLYEAGVSVWLDSLTRDMLRDGSLKKLIDAGLRGQTSNPTIFEGAITKSKMYDEQIRTLSQGGHTARDICWGFMVEDVQGACDEFAQLYKSSGGKDGFVSLELDPTKANDTEGSIKQALELWPRVDRPNLMIKVPATEAGLPVISRLLQEGFNVNVTLLFAVERYDEVISTHMDALEKRLAKGQPIDKIASVASFFVSRVDTEADKRIDALKDAAADKIAAVKHKVAVANALVAYEKFQQRTGSERWKKLEAAGAQIQRPLWASTSMKDAARPDTLYVDALVGPHCVNTMPDKTMDAIANHGLSVASMTPEKIAEAHKVLDALQGLGIDLKDITLNTLVTEGVKKFADSYTELLSAVEKSANSMKVG
jgi:transaldolase